MQFNINFSRFYDKHFGNQISAHDNYDVFAWTDSFSLLFKTQLIKYWNAISFITNSRSLFKLMSIELVMPSNHLIFCRPLLFPPSIFPSIRVFSNGISASTSVLPMNIQGWFLSFFFFLSFFSFSFFWFPLGWTGWISLQPKRLSRVFSNIYTKWLQSCPTLCDPVDYSPPGSSVHGFFRKQCWSESPALLQRVTLASGISELPGCFFTIGAASEATGHIWNQTRINWEIRFCQWLQNTLP